MAQKTMRISVRNLVEFLLRSGDLDNRRGGRKDAEAMQAGSRLHRKLQAGMGSGYRAEVTLKKTVEYGSVTVSVEGRADGVWQDGGIPAVDEIKGTYGDVSRMVGPVPVHLAQAKCYAHILAEQNGYEKIRVRMVYACLDTEEVRYFTEDYSAEDLASWFGGLMEMYRKWVVFSVKWQEERTASLRKLVFPYAYREGQKELAAGVYRSILRRKRLFIQAPTGVGKTLSVLFPALKAMGEGLCGKIFYLTARTITRTVAADALDILRGQEIRVKSLTLTAKEKLCVCEETDCNPDHCPYAKGHFDRINDAVYALWTEGPDACTREAVLDHAARWRVCPFELSLDLSDWMDAVICDYNYVFDPNVYLKRFFGEGAKGEYLFLVDEAHNLVERGRSMYSEALCKEDFLEMKRLIRGKDAALAKALERCNRHLLELKRECADGWQRLPQVGAFSLQLVHLVSELERFLEYQEQENLRKTLTDFYFSIRRFLHICDCLDENYEIYTRLAGDGRFWLHLYCVCPAANLRLCLDRGISTVFFSATLLPVNYYKTLLTGEPEDYAVYARSPFDAGHRLLLIGTDVSSRYTRRGEREYQRMADYVKLLVSGKKGNYLIFFPSYRMLDEVCERCRDADFLCVRQDASMDEQEREDFLKLFEEEREESLAAFCVMGGIFSEGIDLPADRLIGAMVVGTGLPQVCLEREILKEYFAKKGLDGFAYAYQYPGMNKVQQAAGRVIRTDEDRGVILLLDDRFREPAYKKLFPREWEQHEYCRLDSLEQKLREFWSENTE